MPVNSSGTISIAGSTSGQSIALELGLPSTGTLSMSQLYRGGTYVKAGIGNTRNTGVPSSGAISLSNLYSMVRRAEMNITYGGNSSFTQQTITGSGSTVSYTWGGGVSGYIAGQTDLDIILPSTSEIYSTSEAAAALTFSGFSSGDVIRVTNYGIIRGKGGTGATAGAANPGSAGGDAINYNPSNAEFYPFNYGTLAGGGGGGGIGAAGIILRYSYDQYGNITGSNYYYVRGGGAGGGAGNLVGQGGNGHGNVSLTSYISYAAPGSAGSATAGGAGALGDYGYYFAVDNNYLVVGGSGGAGGARGAAGSGGTLPYFNGPSGVQYFPNSYSSYGSAYPTGLGYGVLQNGLGAGPGGAAGAAIRGFAKSSQSLAGNGTVYGALVN